MSVQIDGTFISGNTASGTSGGGGGLNNHQGALTLTNSTVGCPPDGIAPACANTASSSLGGGIANMGGGVLTIHNSSVSGNSAPYGGGIYAYYDGATVTQIDGSVISGNTATGSNVNGSGGGGIENEGKLAISDSTIGCPTLNPPASCANTAPNGVGGGLANWGPLTVDTTVIGGNSAPQGGGLYAYASSSPVGALVTGSAAIAGSTIAGNQATTSGGGGIANDGTLTITGTLLGGNSAATDGGGFENRGTLTISNSTISCGANATGSCGNSATGSGGGGANLAGAVTVYSNNLTLAGSLTVDGTTVSSNTAQGSGGGIENGSGATLQVTSSTIGCPRDAIASSCANSTLGGNGGGISNSGTLTLDSSTVSGNIAGTSPWVGAEYGGGIENAGRATISDSTISANKGYWGAGVNTESSSTTTITNSTVASNQAGYIGGGVDNNNGTLAVVGSAISGNSASDGGGLYNAAGSLTAVNSTITGNSAGTSNGAGVSVQGGSASLVNATDAGNSTGLNLYVGAGAGTVTVASSILAGSATNCGGAPPTDGGYNLDDGTSCGFSATSATSHSLSGTNPTLGPLQSNGGPTQTVALLPSSPAIDAIPTSSTANGTDCNSLVSTLTSLAASGLAITPALVDQRGVARPQGSNCDIGAYEAPSAGVAGTYNFTVNTTNDTTLSGACANQTAGQCSLREAILEANAAPAGSNVIMNLPAGTYLLQSSLGPLNVTSTNGLTIAGAGSPTVDGGGATQLFVIQSGATVTMSGLTLTHGRAVQDPNHTCPSTGFGGALVNAGNLTLTSVAVTNSTTECYGGGIYNTGTLTLNNSTVSGNGNQTNASGGGIYNAGTAHISGSSITGNSGYYGGGLESEGTTYAANSTFNGNTAWSDGPGGGIDVYGGQLYLVDSTVTGNTTTIGNGDEIAVSSGGSATLTGVTLAGGASHGGSTAALSNLGTVTIADSIVSSSAAAACAATISDAGYNLVSDSTCGLSAATSLLLGPLTSNGGPTETIAPQSGSPAIDAIPLTSGAGECNGLLAALQAVLGSGATLTDQRGISRPQGSRCDIGAFEAVPTSASSSTVSANPNTVPADGSTTATITVTLLDVTGQPVSGRTVSLSPSISAAHLNITPSNGTSDASGVVTFNVTDTVAEIVTYTATDTSDSLPLQQTATVTFKPAPVSAASSTVTASATSVPADGTHATSIVVQLKDANGNPVASKSVSLTTTTSGSQSKITAVNGALLVDGSGNPAPVLATTGVPGHAMPDGTMTFTIVDGTAEPVTYSATDTTDAIQFTQGAQMPVVTFTALASAASSTVSVDLPTVPANGATDATVTITVKDASGTALSGKQVLLAGNNSQPQPTPTPQPSPLATTLPPTSGCWPAGGGYSTVCTTNNVSAADGTVVYTVTDAWPESVTYTAVDVTDKVRLTQTAQLTFAPVASAGDSTVVASATSLPADGIATSVITATLRDPYGDPLPGKAVKLTAGSGSSSIIAVNGALLVDGSANPAPVPATTGASSVTQDGTGVIAAGAITFTVTSATAGGPITYAATDLTDSNSTVTPPLNIVVAQTAQVTFTAPPAALSITTSSPLPGAQVGASYSQALAASGGTSPYNWALANGSSLPAGLSLSSGGIISGTPTAAGTSTFTVTVTDSLAATASQQLSLTVAQGTATISIAPYNLTYDGSSHTASGTATAFNGTDLSSGLNLSGTAHTNAGTYASDTWSFHDSAGNYADASGTVSDVISQADAYITPNGYYTIYDGNPHTATGTATGVLNEDLSGGLSLGGTTHTHGGYYTDTWTFHDSTGNYADQTGTVYDEIDQASANVAVSGYSVTYDGNAYTATGTATGVTGEDLSSLLDLSGTTHIDAVDSWDSWSFAGSQDYMPDGNTVEDVIWQANATINVTGYSVAYDGNMYTATGTATGVNGEDLSWALDLNSTTHGDPGTYTDSWFFSGTIDYNPASGSVTDVITGAPLTITTTSLPGAEVGVPYSQTLAASGGASPYSWSVTPGSLPTWASLDGLTGTISGTPTSVGGASFTVTVTDALGGMASQALTISVTATPSAGTAPAAPTNVIATAGNGSATVNWTPPTSAGTNPDGTVSSLTGFTVTVSPSVTGSPFTYSGTAVASATITGLTNGTSYTFSVAATNTAGLTGSAGVSNAVTPSAGTAPGAPANVIATASNGSATVNWTPPTSAGTNPDGSSSSLTGFTVTVSPSVSGSPFTYSGSAVASATITGLTNGTSYTFSVTATNALGMTGPAGTATATPNAGTAPGAPANVIATASNGSATVNWTPPTSVGTNPDGSPSSLSGFTVTVSPGIAGSPFTYSGAAVASATITGLTNGTSYTFSVTATNALNLTGPAGVSNAVTPSAGTAPGAPASVIATAGNGSATVNWTPPTATGTNPDGSASSLTGFTVTVSPSITGSPFTYTGAAVASATITGLTNGTTYTFSVTATNALGLTGPAGTATAAPNAGTAPGAPASVIATAGNGSATVNWTPPTSAGTNPDGSPSNLRFCHKASHRGNPSQKNGLFGSA